MKFDPRQIERKKINDVDRQSEKRDVMHVYQMRFDCKKKNIQNDQSSSQIHNFDNVGKSVNFICDFGAAVKNETASKI